MQSQKNALISGGEYHTPYCLKQMMTAMVALRIKMNPHVDSLTIEETLSIQPTHSTTIGMGASLVDVEGVEFYARRVADVVYGFIEETFLKTPNVQLVMSNPCLVTSKDNKEVFGVKFSFKEKLSPTSLLVKFENDGFTFERYSQCQVFTDLGVSHIQEAHQDHPPVEED